MPSEDVRVTDRLRAALHDYADVTFSITTEVPDDRATTAMRDVWRALWDVGADAPPGPMGDVEIPSYVSDPVSIAPGTWKITVDFAHVLRERRGTAPDVIAAVLRRHAATPAVLDEAALTEEEYHLARETPGPTTEGTYQQPTLYRRRQGEDGRD